MLWIVAATAAAVVAAEDAAVFSVVIHRHGDRSPVDCLPLAVDADCRYWADDGYGMLTDMGMDQLHNLGVNLRQRYVVDFGMLNATYQREDVSVRSTDYDRTLMSANSLLTGLYPPGTGPLTGDQLQPVPIHTEPLATDDVLHSVGDPPCPRYGALLLRDRASKAWQDMYAAHETLMKSIPALFGVPEVGMDEVCAASTCCSDTSPSITATPPCCV
jgi:acid phosphatase